MKAVFQLKIWKIQDCILFLQKQNQINRFMGSVYEKEAQPVQKKRGSVKSKGDRLGWLSRSEAQKVNSKIVVDKGEIVSSSYCYMSCKFKLIP